MLRVDAPEAWAWSVPGNSPVRDAAGALVGFTTSSARGAQTGAAIAMGYVFSDCVETAQTKLADACAADGAIGAGGLRVECYGHSWAAELLSEPPAPVRGFD